MMFNSMMSISLNAEGISAGTVYPAALYAAAIIFPIQFLMDNFHLIITWSDRVLTVFRKFLSTVMHDGVEIVLLT